MDRWLIVGLGNPGGKYEKTRHNVGFMVLDALSAKLQASSFKFQAKLNAQVSKGSIENHSVILAKPEIFMNSSGTAIKKLIGHWSLNIDHLVVIHDDIDLPLGAIRIARDGGSAGHKGVQSIISALGTEDFMRVRVGIQPESEKPGNVESFVLKNFAKNELPTIEKAIEHAVSAIETILSKGLEQAMNRYNQ